MYSFRKSQKDNQVWVRKSVGEQSGRRACLYILAFTIKDDTLACLTEIEATLSGRFGGP